MAADIAKFTRFNAGRHLNDINNKLRENVITHLWNPPKDFVDHPEFGVKWTETSDKFKKSVSSLCVVPFDDLVVKKKAGRKFNYDFKFTYMKDRVVVHTENIEFKHNAKSICDNPQYVNLSENIGFMPYHSYGEFFYDEYIEKLCELAELEVPNKDTYMKFVYQNNYSKFPFFEKLKAKEAEIKDKKSEMVNESISEYLEKYSAMLSLPMLNYEIERTQTKQYLLWDGMDFHLDKFTEDEMKVTGVDSIKNGNTIIVNSKGTAKHHMLLRWKNHKGILYPAWQIKLAR